MVSIRHLESQNIFDAGIALSEAFMDDPLQKYVFPDEQERNLRSPFHFEAVVRYGHKFGEVYSTRGMEAAAVWLTPGNTEVTPEKAHSGGLGKLPEILGEDAAGRFFTVMDFLEPFHKEDVEEPHWYTMVIGVKPEFCGLGYGSSLMQSVMDKAEATRTPIYLETAEPSNVLFYEKLGFSIMRELVEPESKLPLWTFKKVF